MSFEQTKEYFDERDAYYKLHPEICFHVQDFMTVNLDHLKSSIDELAADFAAKDLTLKGKGFLDLGCGDGRVLAVASSYGMNPVGVEHCPILAEESRINIRNLSKFGTIGTVVEGDLRNTRLYDIQDFMIVYNFLTLSIDVAKIIHSEGLPGTLMLLEHFAGEPLVLPHLKYVKRIGKNGRVSMTDLYVNA